MVMAATAADDVMDVATTLNAFYVGPISEDDSMR